MAQTANLTTTTVSSKGHQYKRYVVTYRNESGQRKRSTFKQKQEAEKFKKQVDKDAARREERGKIIKNKIGKDAEKLDAEQLRDAVDALTTLEGHASLTEAANFYMSELKRRAKDVPTVRKLITDYIAESESQGLRYRSVKELRERLGKFAESFGDSRIDDVTRSEIQTWLNSLKNASGKPCASNTIKHYRYGLTGLFNYAIEHEYLHDNPAKQRTRSRRQTDSNGGDYNCEIFSLAEVRCVLAAARDKVSTMLAPVALGLFAGIRAAEIQRLTWDHIDVAKGIIKITGDVAKKRSVRNVSISDNLRQWLMMIPNRTGSVGPATGGSWQHHHRRLVRKAGLQRWPHNVLRHSFGSYFLEATGDATRTAFEMGHRDTGDLLFEHYRQLCRREDAEAFWEITPDKVGNIQEFVSNNQDTESYKKAASV